MKLHKHRAEAFARLEGELAQPSLYQVAISKLCARFEAADMAGAPGLRIGSAQRAVQGTCGSGSMKIRARIGTCMSWPKSWWILRIISAAGGSTT